MAVLITTVLMWKYSVGHSLFKEVMKTGMGILSISMGCRQRYSCHLTDSYLVQLVQLNELRLDSRRRM